MANDKKFVARNGLQTQNIDFVSNNESNTVTVTVSEQGILSVEGDVQLSNSLYDSTGSKGNVGEILLATSQGIKWEAQTSEVGTPTSNGDILSSNTDGTKIWISPEKVVLDSKVASLMPYLINANEKYLVPANTQALFSLPLEINGVLEIEGILVQV